MEEFNLKIGNKDLKVKIKNLAEQANASVWVEYGETVIFATAVMGREKPELGFFPLTVNFVERYYAAGKIYGSRYFKREGRPSTESIITSRLIDRAIRPLFPKGFKNEVQVIITCLSWDGKNDPDVPGLIGASLALSLSNIPWNGPLGAVRIGSGLSGLTVNPNYNQREEGKLSFVFSGVKDPNLSINMIEGEAKEATEKEVLEAAEKGEKSLEKIIKFQQEIIKKVGPKKVDFTPEKKPEIEKEVKAFIGNKLERYLYQGMEKVNELKEELREKMKGAVEEKNYALDFFEEQIDQLVHKNVLEKEKRPDNRDLEEIREISTKVNVLPRTHGSGLFSRGKTKALSILTLGGPEDQQLLEGMEIVGKKRFMHHYNFPPYSAGDVKPLRGPGRREIGHGVLAERALLPILPNFEDFPYAIRVVSEILSSNGSTSMASVSSSSLALMDAGVPIKRAAAGIAMGLIRGKDSYKILTDIQGPEDHHGDMDLKVAGTKKGITAIQMDVKIKGITKEILKEALEKAKKARLSILEKMGETIKEPREKISEKAPIIISLRIDPEKIGLVIGSGGSTINRITEETGAEISIEESGLIYISAEKEENAKKAAAKIKNITKEIRVGETYQGRVKKILDFGAVIEIAPGKEGLVHISEIAPHHVKRIEDELKIGEKVPVKVISIDENGKLKLSIKKA